MEPIKLNLVDSFDSLLNKGDGRIFSYGDGRHGLIIVCPQCGKVSGTDKHIYNKETKSVTPSIIHAVELGGCGWHGFVMDGWFKDA